MAPKCKICRDIYAPGQKAPRGLPCGHSFCTECLKRLVNSSLSLKCPTCRKNHERVAISDLCINYDLMSVSSSSTPESVSCDKATGAEQDTITLVVKDLMDQTFRLVVPSSHTVRQVKQLLQAQYGVAPDTTRLLFRGQRLHDDKTLAQYKVVTGNVIQMSTRYLGGTSGL